RRPPALHFERLEQLGVQVGRPRRYHIDDHHADAVLEVAGALGSKGPAAAGPVLVGRADQLDGAAQLGAAQILVNADLKGVQLRADPDLRLSEVGRRQGILIELLGNEGGPVVVKPFPAARAVQGRVEMVEEWHNHFSLWVSSRLSSFTSRQKTS